MKGLYHACLCPSLPVLGIPAPLLPEAQEREESQAVCREVDSRGLRANFVLEKICANSKNVPVDYKIIYS